jgi:hypothetical protein
VEFAGTLNDFVRSDLRRKYPQLTGCVRVTLLQSAQTILMQVGQRFGCRPALRLPLQLPRWRPRKKRPQTPRWRRRRQAHRSPPGCP